MGWALSTYTSRAYFALCLHRDKFLLERVRFSRLTPLGHVLPYTFAILDFSWHNYGFLNSHASGIVCSMPPPWWISLNANRIFLTHMSLAHFVLCLCHGKFLLMADFSLYGSGFPNLLLEHILLYVFTMADFSQSESGFSDSHASVMFYLVLPLQ